MVDRLEEFLQSQIVEDSLGSFSSHKKWRTGYGVSAAIEHGGIVREFQ
jgi:hypothetical protein